MRDRRAILRARIGARFLRCGMSPPGRPKGEYTAVRSTELA
jgi:hypothetical protein